jgi:hypothetical protein
VGRIYFSDGWYASLEIRPKHAQKTIKQKEIRQFSAIRRDNRPNASKENSKGTSKDFRKRERP